MAFPTTSVIEDFTTKGTDWTALVGSITFTGGRGIGSEAEHNFEYWDTATFGPDSEAYVTINDYVNASDIEVYARFSNSTYNAYGLDVFDGSSWHLFRLDGGVATAIDMATVSYADGSKIGLECIGSAIKGYHYTGGAWSEVLSYPDNIHSGAGYIAINTRGTANYIDDFGGGTVAAVTNLSIHASECVGSDGFLN